LALSRRLSGLAILRPVRLLTLGGDGIDEGKIRKATKVLIGSNQRHVVLQGESREVGIVDVVSAKPELRAKTGEDLVVGAPRLDPNRYGVAAQGA
jgi:hypothetical protein